MNHSANDNRFLGREYNILQGRAFSGRLRHNSRFAKAYRFGKYNSISDNIYQNNTKKYCTK
jgi:hypothetical protein